MINNHLLRTRELNKRSVTGQTHWTAFNILKKQRKCWVTQHLFNEKFDHDQMSLNKTQQVGQTLWTFCTQPVFSVVQWNVQYIWPGPKTITQPNLCKWGRLGCYQTPFVIALQTKEQCKLETFLCATRQATCESLKVICYLNLGLFNKRKINNKSVCFKLPHVKNFGAG